MNIKTIRCSLKHFLSASLLLVLIAGAVTVHATFPGANAKIAFASDRDGNFEIYVMNADGTGQTNLTNNAAIDSIQPGRPTAPRSRSSATATATARST